MKHCHHCHLDDQIKKFKAGKLGLLGGILIVGHFLFHVAECLILPVIIAGFSRKDAEAVESLDEIELSETTLDKRPSDLFGLRQTFFESLQQNYPLQR